MLLDDGRTAGSACESVVLSVIRIYLRKALARCIRHTSRRMKRLFKTQRWLPIKLPGLDFVQRHNEACRVQHCLGAKGVM